MMSYSTFNKKKVDQLSQPMFFGENVNVSRYDQQKHPLFEKLIERQLSFFWRPEEIDVSRDKRDFDSLPPQEQHMFLSNLKYQTLLDSVQGRSPNIAFLPIVSLPELETWIETWAFSETIHSRSYTHILRNVCKDPSLEFDNIMLNEEIQKRANSVTRFYDELIELVMIYSVYGVGVHNINGKEVVVSLREIKKKLYLAMASVNILEGVRFYVSFACSFAFAERELMEGNAKIIKFIARDETLHLQGTQYMMNLFRKGVDDPEMGEIAKELRPALLKMYDDAVKEEKEWGEYLCKDGSMIGLNSAILSQYAEYIANVRMMAIGEEPRYETKENPIPWISAYLNSDNVQVAPQEAEISSYLVGQMDMEINDDDFSDLSL